MFLWSEHEKDELNAMDIVSLILLFSNISEIISRELKYLWSDLSMLKKPHVDEILLIWIVQQPFENCLNIEFA